MESIRGTREGGAMSQTTSTSAVAADTVAAAAERLKAAQATGIPCPPVRDLIGSDDVNAAYAVQQQITTARLADGATIVGRKIGLTSTAVQEQLGVHQPDFGILFDDMALSSGDHYPADAVSQPRIEAEIAFVLAEDLIDGPLDQAQVRSAIDHAVAALEICGSRIADWDISFADTVSDNASAGAYVLGTETRTLDEFEPREVEMAMSIDGETVSTGTGAACLGDPIDAVVWLARQARELGDPLRAGQVILSGALGPMRPVSAGNTVEATVSGLGSVQVTFNEEQA